LRTRSAVRIAALIVAASLSAGTGPAWSQTSPVSKIQPNQQFVGLINGHTQGATINMACFGPIKPGQRGHPFGGQWAEVLGAEVIATYGFTGSLGTSIVADFPGTSATPQRLTFTYYGVQDPIPTSFLLPCGGQAPVVFHPEPTSPTAKSFTVTVTFVGQP
jgi:hypothetical protein